MVMTTEPCEPYVDPSTLQVSQRFRERDGDATVDGRELGRGHVPAEALRHEIQSTRRHGGLRQRCTSELATRTRASSGSTAASASAPSACDATARSSASGPGRGSAPRAATRRRSAPGQTATATRACPRAPGRVRTAGATGRRIRSDRLTARGHVAARVRLSVGRNMEISAATATARLCQTVSGVRRAIGSTIESSCWRV